MTNAEKFVHLFGLYATELWSKSEKDFLIWLNAEYKNIHDANVGELIDRQAAIDTVEFGITYAKAFDVNTGESKELFKEGNDALKKAVKRLKELPSVQPEIIRCKDCKWWDKEDDMLLGYCLAIKHGFYSRNWDISIRRTYPEDFFCADAELRGDSDEVN